MDYSAAAAYSPVVDSSAVAGDCIEAAEDKVAVIQGYIVATEDSFVVAEGKESGGKEAVAEVAYTVHIVAPYG